MSQARGGIGERSAKPDGSMAGAIRCGVLPYLKTPTAGWKESKGHATKFMGCTALQREVLECMERSEELSLS